MPAANILCHHKGPGCCCDSEPLVLGTVEYPEGLSETEVAALLSGYICPLCSTVMRDYEEALREDARLAMLAAKKAELGGAFKVRGQP